ncbi:MAG: hypothetical protein AAGN82_08635 [Myxococcota bacterium]
MAGSESSSSFEKESFGPTELEVAACSHCGAAVRLSAMTQPLSCAYCGVLLKTETEGLTAPTLRIRKSPLPEPPTESKIRRNQWYSRIFIGLSVMALVTLPFDLFPKFGDAEAQSLLAFFLFMFGISSHATQYVLREKRDAIAKRMWLRNHGETGRATVVEIIAGEGYEATLRLRVEVIGKPGQSVMHKATIPALFVPKLAAGVCLPVVVHPHEPSDLEVQWHLV